MIASHAVSAALALGSLLTPAGGYHGHLAHGTAAAFRAGAAVTSITPPAAGHAPADGSQCAGANGFTGPRRFAFEEPYTDLKGSGHYDSGDPYLDCNLDLRWNGNLLGGGNSNPRYFDRVADPVTARALAVSARGRTVVVEVLDQEGVFDVYQQQIRAKVARDGVHADGIFISATHDESAPDSLGLGGIALTTSGVNPYWTRYMVDQAAGAIERAVRAEQPARIRLTDVLEPANLRQCWSSYPFVDDQHMPVLEAVTPRGRAIATLADVSQHAETLGFNRGTPALDAQRNWVSADWVAAFRSTVERRLGGVAIEMAGTVGSVESPEVYRRPISRVPQAELGADHPAGCRTLFRDGRSPDLAGREHVPLGYSGETRAYGQQLAGAIVDALRSGSYQLSHTNALWGARRTICVPLDNALFAAAASLGVFGARPGYNADCTQAAPVLPNGSSGGQALRSEVAAFGIGDAEFASVPGEVFPFTVYRSFLGAADMPDPGPALPPWLLPHLHARFRFIDGLGEDMIGYIFPAGNAVGIPSSANLSPPDRDRFGCNHSDDAEAVSPHAGDLVARGLIGILDRHDGRSETVRSGRYVLPGGGRSRDPLGGPGSLGCTVRTTFTAARRPATAVELAGGQRIRPLAWMSLDGLPQRRPDRDTRGYFDRRGRRVWLDVYPDVR